MVFATENLLEPTLAYEINDEIVTMGTKDVYKELRLRGYNYQGMFRSIEECDVSGIRGKIKWDNKWVPFLDSLLQVKILQIDTRGTIVPTGLEKLSINVDKHIVECQKNDNLLPIHTFSHLSVTRYYLA